MKVESDEIDANSGDAETRAVALAWDQVLCPEWKNWPMPEPADDVEARDHTRYCACCEYIDTYNEDELWIHVHGSGGQWLVTADMPDAALLWSAGHQGEYSDGTWSSKGALLNMRRDRERLRRRRWLAAEFAVDAQAEKMWGDCERHGGAVWRRLGMIASGERTRKGEVG